MGYRFGSLQANRYSFKYIKIRQVQFVKYLIQSTLATVPDKTSFA